MDHDWWEKKGFIEFPQAKILDDFVRSRGYVPLPSEEDTVKVMHREHSGTGKRIDIAPLSKGANVWTALFDAPSPASLNRRDYLPSESRNSNLQNAFKHNKGSSSQSVIAWKMKEVNDAVLQDLDNLLRTYTGEETVKPLRTKVLPLKKDEKSQLSLHSAKKKDFSKAKLECLEEKLKAVEASNLATEEIREAKRRKFQNDLRTLLLQTRKSCEITGVKTKEILIASHIQPWKECTDAEKIDLENLLLLSAHYDNLFDKGLISFSNQGKILISPALDEDERNRLNLNGKESLKTIPSLRMCGYLKFHRKMHGFE